MLDSRLDLIIGPMFSGKTSELINIYNKYKISNVKGVLLINHFTDNRYTDNSFLVTHSNIKEECILLNNLTVLLKDEKLLSNKVFLINEGQFFDDLFNVVLELVEKHNKIVYIAGLDGDFNRNKIGQILDLIPYCDNIIKKKSICEKCKLLENGLFTYKKQKNNKVIEIGGKDLYIPLCRKCFIES